MDRIITNLVESFIEENEIPEPFDESKNFEDFCNFSVVSSEHDGKFSPEDVSMGKSHGVDGLAIIVNGNLVVTSEEIKDLIQQNNFLEVVFIFIQAKTSNNFNSSDISNFFTSVKDFFSETPKLTQTCEIKKAIGLKEVLWDNFSKLRKNPICKLYYVTTGRWEDNSSLNAIISQQKTDLENLDFFDKVEFIPCGSREIQRLYKKTREAVSCEFTFDKRVALPKIEGVQESYSGIIKFEEFKKVIIDDSGKMRNVFYENVRDFLGDININKRMESSLKGSNPDAFCILNNGVTIVADSKVNRGDDFAIENYQIVNGCQTSHILFNNKDIPNTNKINIPLKLIITNNDDVKNKITVATNSQTAIPKEQLEALSNFQKDLEAYYNTIDEKDARLYYERRTKQYKDVKKARIVTIREQIKTFASMFLNQPHLASGYFSKVYKQNEEKMFRENDKHFPYYISSLAMYKLESYFKNREIEKKYRIARYHMLMLFRLLVTNNSPVPYFNSRDIEEYCENIKKVLLSEKAKKYFKKSIDLIDSIKSIDIDDPKTIYSVENTEKLIKKLNSLP